MFTYFYQKAELDLEHRCVPRSQCQFGSSSADGMCMHFFGVLVSIYNSFFLPFLSSFLFLFKYFFSSVIFLIYFLSFFIIFVLYFLFLLFLCFFYILMYTKISLWVCNT